MTKEIKIGDVFIGGANRLAIQSMTNTQTTDISATLNQIERLYKAGADLVRVSVPSPSSAKALKEITKNSPVPIIGDIHFNSKLAVAAIENGAAKIRINPTNMPQTKDIFQIVTAAKEYNVPIRLGFNAGSFTEGKEITSIELADTALEYVKIVEDMGYNNLVLSVKSSNVSKTVNAYKQIAKRTEYPLHIGISEAGTRNLGIYKSVAGIGALLLLGIGDTIRVSLSADPVEEIEVAKKILRALNLTNDFVEVISCPTCARTSINVSEIAEAVEEATKDITVPMKIAVMGCVVNGIGEGKGADFGIAGGKKISTLFKNGEIIKTVSNEDILKELMTLVEERLNG